MFSTWVGPGAYSYSFTQQRVTFIPGETVAQRTLLEVINSVPERAIAQVARPLSVIDIWFRPAASFSSLLSRSAMFWAALTFLLSWVWGTLRRRSRAADH